MRTLWLTPAILGSALRAIARDAINVAPASCLRSDKFIRNDLDSRRLAPKGGRPKDGPSNPSVPKGPLRIWRREGVDENRLVRLIGGTAD